MGNATAGELGERLDRLRQLPAAPFVTIASIDGGRVVFAKTPRAHRAELTGSLVLALGLSALWLVVVGVAVRQGSAHFAWLVVSVLAVIGVLWRLGVARARTRPVLTLDCARGEIVVHERSHAVEPVDVCTLWVHHGSTDDPIAPDAPMTSFASHAGWQVDVQTPKGSTAIYVSANRDAAVELARELNACAAWRSAHVDGWKSFYEEDPLGARK